MEKTSVLLKLEPLGVGFLDDCSEYISTLVRLEGREVRETPEFGPWDCREKMSDRELVDFLTLTWSFPSSLTSASVCRGSFPSREMMSESTLKETIDPAVPGNCSTISSLAPLYSKSSSMRVYLQDS